MDSTGKDYRRFLTRQVKPAGEYIAEHADELVDNAMLKTSLSIFIDFEPTEFPVIRITQEHAMENVIEVIMEDRKSDE